MDQKRMGTIAMYAIPVAIAAMLGYHFLMPHGEAPAKAKTPAMAFAATPQGSSSENMGARAKSAAPVMSPYGGALVQPPAETGMVASTPSGISPGQGPVDDVGTVAASVTAVDLSVLNEDMHTLSAQLDNIEAQLAAMRAIQQRAAVSLRLRRPARTTRDAVPGKPGGVKADIAGYRLQAIGQTEAWLTDPDGSTVIVVAGQQLRGGLRVEAVAPDGVVTNRGTLGF